MGRRAPLLAAVLRVLPALAHRHPADGRLRRQALHLQRGRPERPRLAGDHRGAEHASCRRSTTCASRGRCTRVQATSDEPIRSSLATQGMLLLAAGGVAAVFVYPFPLIDAAQRAVNVFA